MDDDLVARLREKAEKLEWLKKMGGTDKYFVALISDAADEIERLRAKSVVWQPIETAPKDVTSVLVCGIWDGELNACEDHPDVWKAHFSCDEWWVDGGEYYSQHVINPTYWMPLPELPKDVL